MKDEEHTAILIKSKSQQSAAAGESAGKKSTTAQGGLAKLLFGQGVKPAAEEEGSESEEKMQLVEEFSGEDSDDANGDK